MKTRLITRQATYQDYDLFVELNSEVQALHAQAEPKIFKPDGKMSQGEYQAMLADSNIGAYIAFYGEEPVGYILCEVKNRKESAFTYALTAFYIQHLLVREKFRGRGYGKGLLEFALGVAQERGISRIELDAWTFNAPALKLFRRFGFQNFNEKLFLLK